MCDQLKKKKKRGNIFPFLIFSSGKKYVVKFERSTLYYIDGSICKKYGQIL